MDFNKIFPILLEITAKLKQDFSDSQLTVDELIDLIKSVVDELGFGDIVILDLTKHKEGK